MFEATTASARSGDARRRVLRQLIGAVAAIGVGAPTLAATRSLHIGSTFDNSSVEKANGSALHLGATAFFNALNKAGGVGGMRVELSMVDDQFKPDLARDNAGPNTGTVGLRKKAANNVFWVRANYDQEMEKLVSTAATLGIRNIGLVHPNDPLGLSLLAAFKAATSKFNLAPAIIATTPNTTSSEVEPAAREIAKAAPQVVIMGLAGTAPALVKALRTAGSTSTIYGLSIGASAANIRTLGDDSRGIGFSIVVPSPFASKHEIVRHYQADMQANGTTEYSLPSLEGYINARVLTEGLRRAGGNPTRESLIAALESVDNYDLGGLRIGFGKGRREGGSFVDVAVIGQGGRMIS
jgi:branched-chain amino acid transport system substrate-binding protein